MYPPPATYIHTRWQDRQDLAYKHHGLNQPTAITQVNQPVYVILPKNLGPATNLSYLATVTPSKKTPEEDLDMDAQLENVLPA